MLTFTGTHGTSSDRAENIVHEGFDPTVVGRAGKGAYFWRYFKSDEIARKLAIGWFNAANKKNAYHGERDPKCAIIFGSIDVTTEETISFDAELMEEICLILEKLPEITDDDIHNAYEFIVTRVENLIRRSIVLIETSVQSPKGMSFKVHHVVGNPAIFVVRNDLGRIKSTIVVP